MRLPILVLVASTMWLGCVVEPYLRPAHGALLASSGSTAAIAEGQGVRMVINTHAWVKNPSDLDHFMSPVHVAITNHSGHRLRLAYRDVALVGDDGFRSPALDLVPGQMPVSAAPSAVTDGITLVDYHPARPVGPPRPPLPPRFHHRRFYVAPHFRPWYPGLFIWPQLFIYDPGAYHRHAWPLQLPTDDMLAEGLPEGVIDDGGQIDGFLYFQRPPPRAFTLRFELTLVDADTQQPFGGLAIPLSVRQ